MPRAYAVRAMPSESCAGVLLPPSDLRGGLGGRSCEGEGLRSLGVMGLRLGVMGLLGLMGLCVSVCAGAGNV